MTDFEQMVYDVFTEVTDTIPVLEAVNGSFRILSGQGNKVLYDNIQNRNHALAICKILVNGNDHDSRLNRILENDMKILRAKNDILTLKLLADNVTTDFKWSLLQSKIQAAKDRLSKAEKTAIVISNIK